MNERGVREMQTRHGVRVGRRDFLAIGAAGLAVAGLPRAARGQAKPSGEIVAGVSERDADARSRQPLLDLGDLRAAPHLRPAGRRDQRLEVRPGARRVVARRQQHDLALHAAQGRDLPRRHAVQRRQRRVTRSSGSATTPSSSSRSSTRTSSPSRRTATTRWWSRRSARSAPCPPTSRCSACCRRRPARTRRRSSRSRSAPGRSGSRAGPTATTSSLTANPSYWKPGVPKVEKVDVPLHPRALDARRPALRAGRAPRDRPGARPTSWRRSRAAAGSRCSTCPAVEAQRWIFQLAKEPVKDPRLRQAISPRHRPERDHQGPAPRLRPAGRQPGAAGPDRPHQPRRQAVRPREGHGRSSSRPGYTNVSIDFVLMKDLYPKQLEIAQAVAAMLGDVGIKVNIKNLEIATAREHRTAGTYDMFFSGWAHMPHDPDWYFGQWFTKAGAEKLTRYNNPRVEQLIAEGRVPDAEGAPGEVRGAREDPLGGGAGDLAVLQRGHLRRQRPAAELRGAPRLLRPAERRRAVGSDRLSATAGPAVAGPTAPDPRAEAWPPRSDQAHPASGRCRAG